MELRYNEGPRYWQNMFVITRLINLCRVFFVLLYILLLLEFTSSLDRGPRYRGSTIRYIFIYLNSIFLGIRIFQDLNLLLVRFDPISLMLSKAQNAYLYKTALSPGLLRFQSSKAM